jgi:outer membrane protein assembly factor BamB/predicted phosphodiesterase
MRGYLQSVSILFTLATVLTAASAQKQPETFSFLDITDTHQTAAGSVEPLRRLVASAIDEANRPALIIDTGDITESARDEEYSVFKSAISPLSAAKIAFYAVPGNHDVRWRADGKEEFARQFGKVYQSFDYGGAHFVLLDSTVALEHWGHIDKAEIDWLDRDMRKVRADTPIFVFLHHSIGRDGPPTRLVDNEFDLLKKLETHNVVAIFTGHGHTDLAWKTNGIQTLMCRGLYQGSYYHVSVTPVLVTIDRVYTTNPGPAFHVTIPIQRRAKPSQLKAGWDDPNVPFLERKRPAATLEPRAVTDNPDKEKAEYRLEDGPWKPMTKDARDIWRDVFLTKPLPVGVHSADVRLTTSNNVALTDELIFEIERTGTEPTQRWALNLDGPIQSSPALLDDTLYVSSLDNRVYALSTDKGKKRWTFPTKGPILSSPIINDNSLYVGSNDHHLYAIDAKSGKQEWKYDTGGAIVATPAYAAGIVCVGGDKKIYGIEAKSGSLRWSQPAGGFFQSRAATDGSVFYLGGWDNTVYALDAATGEPKWTRKLGRAFYYSPAIASPSVVNGRVYICTNDNTLYSLDARTGETKWSINAPKGSDPLGYSSPVVANDLIYIAGLGDNGDVYAFSTLNGAMRWKTPTGQSFYDSSVHLAPDGKTLAIMGIRGRVSVLSTADGHKQWGYELGPGNIFSTPEYDGIAVYTVTMANDVQAIAGPNTTGPDAIRRSHSTIPKPVETP